MIFASAVYLFTTHITPLATLGSFIHTKKFIAIVAVAAVAVIAAVFWLLRRRQSRA